MTRVRIVAFAVLASLLVVSATPAEAASASLTVGSQHTSASDFDAAESLANVSVTDTGPQAQVSYFKTSDGFEDNDIDGWMGDTGDYTTQSSVVHAGSVALNTTGSDANSMPEFLAKNDTRGAQYVSAYTLEASSAKAGVLLHWDTSTQDGYHFYIDYANDRVVLQRYDSGSPTGLDTASNANIDANTFYRLVLRRAGDQLHATIYTTGGTELAAITTTDTTHTTGRAGVAGDDNGDAVFDDFLATTGFNPNDETGTYVSANHSVTNASEAAVNLSVTNAIAEVSVDEYTGSVWQTVTSATYTTTANHTLDISSATNDKLRVNVTFQNASGNGEPTAELHDESILFVNHQPEVDNSSATPTGGLSDQDTTFEIDVSDREFPTSQGDEVEATLYVDGSAVGSDSLTSNGTASVTHSLTDGGDHTYHWRVEDSYGLTSQSQSYDVRVPATLGIYYETDPDQRITNTNLNFTVRFYPLDAGSSTDVVTRQSDQGRVNLTGLPIGERFVVTAADNASQFTYRRIVIDSLYETSRIYLLNKSEPHSEVIFQLDDPTGQFPPEDTILYVEKPLEVNNSTQYQTIAGDTFGATGRFPVDLQKDSRYRLRIESADGSNERILGAHSVSSSTLETLQVKQIAPSSNVSAGSVFTASLEPFNGSTSIAVRHRDLDDEVKSITYRVQQDGTVIVANTTSTADTYAHIYENLGAQNASYTVDYWITYSNNTTVAYAIPLGDVPRIADRFQIDPGVLSNLSWVFILAVMGLLCIVNYKLAPLGGTAAAAILAVIGTVAIPAPLLGIAGSIGVLVLFGGGRV